MGFAAGLMMKAHSLKEGVKEKSSGINLGNVQGIGVSCILLNISFLMGCEYKEFNCIFLKFDIFLLIYILFLNG